MEAGGEGAEGAHQGTFAAPVRDGGDEFLGPDVDAGGVGMAGVAQRAGGAGGFVGTGFFALACVHGLRCSGVHDGAAAEHDESVS